MNLTRADDCDSEGETLAGVDKSRPSGRAAAPLGRGLITTMLLMSRCNGMDFARIHQDKTDHISIRMMVYVRQVAI